MSCCQRSILRAARRFLGRKSGTKNLCPMWHPKGLEISATTPPNDFKFSDEVEGNQQIRTAPKSGRNCHFEISTFVICARFVQGLTPAMPELA